MRIAVPFTLLILYAGVAARRTAPRPDAPPLPDDVFAVSRVAAQWLDAFATAEARAGIAACIGGRLVRFCADGDPDTPDYAAERLDVVVGTDGRIRRFYRG